MSEEQPPSAPLADEAARLVATLQDWVRQTFPAGGADGHGGPECQWCPVCQFMSVLRGDRPEVSARVAEAGTAVAGAFRALVDATVNTTQPAAESGGTLEPPPPRVQHIDLGGSDE